MEKDYIQVKLSMKEAHLILNMLQDKIRDSERVLDCVVLRNEIENIIAVQERSETEEWIREWRKNKGGE